MMVRNGGLSALVARNGITSHVRTLDPKQYLKMIVMTGNVKCALLHRVLRQPTYLTFHKV